MPRGLNLAEELYLSTVLASLKCTGSKEAVRLEARPPALPRSAATSSSSAGDAIAPTEHTHATAALAATACNTQQQRVTKTCHVHTP